MQKDLQQCLDQHALSRKARNRTPCEFWGRRLLVGAVQRYKKKQVCREKVDAFALSEQTLKIQLSDTANLREKAHKDAQENLKGTIL